MEPIIDFAARRLSVLACAYYHFGTKLVHDAEYDEIACLVADKWNHLSEYFKDVFESAAAIRATGHHIYVSQYAFNSTLHELRGSGVDQELSAHGFEATAVWEGSDGTEVGIMGFGG